HRVIRRGDQVRFVRLPGPPTPGGTARPAPPPVVAAPDPDPERELFTAVLTATLRAFDSMRPGLDTGATSADYRRARQLLEQTLHEFPSLEEFREFDDRIRAIQAGVQIDLDARAKALSESIGRRPG